MAAGALLQALGPGLLGVYAFVTSPIVEEFGASDAQVGLGMSFSILGMALASPVIGPLLDRGPLRAVMLAGVAVMLTSLLGLAQGGALWQLALGMTLASMGIAAYGSVPVQVLVIRWFVVRRGLALALAAVGFSVGSFLVPPVAAQLVSAVGWRGTVEIFGLAAAALAIPVVLFVIVPRPADLGQRPDGAAGEPGAPAEEDEAELDLSRLLRDRNFWLVGVGYALGLAVPVATLFLVRHLEGFGVSREEASLVFIAMGLGGLVGKLVSGPLADRLNVRSVALGAVAALTLGWAGLSQTTTLGGVLLVGPLAGFGAGAMLPMHAMLIGACFDPRQVGRIFGLHAPLGLPFLLSVSPLVGWLRDGTGSFEIPFLVLAGMCLGSFALLSLLRLPRRGSERGQ